MFKTINPAYLSTDQIERLHNEFNSAKPYRHIVADNFVLESVANQLFENFPSIDKFAKHYKGLNENKSEGADFSSFDPLFTTYKQDLTSPEFYKWVSQVTGVQDVFITDDALGCGLHQGVNGSFLDIHIDFNIHVQKNVHRRLNMLLFLNKNWQHEYGGQLELWNADMTKCEKYVEPSFNRLVIFETSEISYHGYTSKLKIPPTESRKSIYAYFYTKERVGAASYHDTVFRAKPDDTIGKKVGTTVKENLKNFVKATFKKIGIPV
jgi:Rps23 Pro-64 3,4-dihydroxylase Tpa1-like proline 4-hydroxylase